MFSKNLGRFLETTPVCRSARLRGLGRLRKNLGPFLNALEQIGQRDSQFFRDSQKRLNRRVTLRLFDQRHVRPMNFDFERYRLLR